ncbi:MAG: vitamin B12 dependent-methionine synthase activation domain-containing protein, partial [Acidimicrobiia bacterium]
ELDRFMRRLMDEVRPWFPVGAVWRFLAAEAAAEWLHARLRADWGFPDPPELTMKDRFASRYRGARYSFGYPACPDINDQAGLFELLTSSDLGVELTERMMLVPEASVSALVLSRPTRPGGS